MRPQPPPRRPRRSRSAPLPVPDELSLVWGLLYDLACAPVWAVRLVLGTARLSDGLRPLVRIAHFASAARATALLIALNLLVFLAENLAQQAGVTRAQFLHWFALTPADVRSGNTLPIVLHVFAHASPAHLVGNLIPLLVFGRVVERHLGPARVLVVYAAAALLSTALSLGVQVATGHVLPTLGASGAVAGLLALGVLFEPLAITFEALVPLPLCVLGWVAIAADLTGLFAGPGAGGGAGGEIDHPAHLGGYLTASLFYFALDEAQRQRARTGLLLNALTAAVLVAMRIAWR